ncbi:MAG: SPFH domain-containing protein [Planctomycetota bacterium]
MRWRRFTFRSLTTAVALSTAGACVLTSLLDTVPVGHVGVRLDAANGVVDRDFDSGVHWSLQGRGDWRFLPAGVRTTEFAEREDGAPLEIRTSDDQTARVGAVALWQVVDGRAWSIVAAGLDASLDERVRDTIEDGLRTELAVLGSEDWFAVARKREALETARPAIASALAELDVELVDLSLLDVRFSEEYTRKLQAKQAAVQKQRRQQAQEAVDRVQRELTQLQQQAKTELARRTGAADLARQERRAAVEAELSSARAAAQLEAAGIRASADRAYAEAVATGQRAVAEAKADSQRARLAALSTPGGRSWLARRAAEQLSIERVVLDPRDDKLPLLLDLDALQALLE